MAFKNISSEQEMFLFSLLTKVYQYRVANMPARQAH